MELLDIYRSILSFANLFADEQGYVRNKTDKSQFLVKDKSLVLPTPEQLRGFNGDLKIVFHPLAENTIRGESPVLQRLMFCINVRLTEVLGAVGMELLKIVGSPALQTRFTPEQTNVIVGIQEADGQSITNLALVMGELFKTKPDRAFVNISLRRGGIYKDKKHSRVGLTVFPFYRDLKENVKIEKIRKKDYPTYIQLHEAILPGLDIPEEYNQPCDGNVAPFLVALLTTAAGIGLRLNEVVMLFKDEIGADYEQYLFNSDWLSSIMNVESLGSVIRQVPVQEGNDGELIVSATPVAETPAMVAPVYTPPVPVPVAAPQAQPQQTYAYPVPPPPAAVAPSAESPYTERGIKFGAIASQNAAVAYAPNTLAPQLHAQAQAEAQARWQQEQIRQWGYIPQQPGMPPPGYGPQPGYAGPPQGYPQPGFPPPGYPQPGYPQPGFPHPGWMPPGPQGWYGNRQ